MFRINVPISDVQMRLLWKNVFAFVRLVIQLCCDRSPYSFAQLTSVVLFLKSCE